MATQCMSSHPQNDLFIMWILVNLIGEVFYYRIRDLKVHSHLLEKPSDILVWLLRKIIIEQTLQIWNTNISIKTKRGFIIVRVTSSCRLY